MIAAMMLPSSLPAVRAFEAGGQQARPGLALASFLGAYAAVWTVFGLVAFSGDVIVQRLIDATPWLVARPWFVAGGVLALVGTYQFVPVKRRSMAACRQPNRPPAVLAGPRRGSIRLALGRGLAHGFAHGLDCLGSSGPLMLLMLGAGLSDLWWMAALGTVMAYETMGRHGRRAASIVGAMLLWAAALVVLPGWLPSAAG